jgi:hypothetical protein
MTVHGDPARRRIGLVLVVVPVDPGRAVVDEKEPAASKVDGVPFLALSRLDKGICGAPLATSLDQGGRMAIRLGRHVVAYSYWRRLRS